MIEDLKADSARWEQERRAKSSRNASGGINAPRDSSNPIYSRKSNSPTTVQYHHSDTYARRQRGGPSESIPFGSGREFDPPPSHDGPGYAGYTQQGGAGQFMPQQQQPQPGYPGANQRTPYPSGYPPAPNQYSQQDPGYVPSGQSNMGYQQSQDTWVHGAARPMNPGYREPSQYSPGMGTRDHMMTTPPQQGNYPPPQHSQPAYGGQDYYAPGPGGVYQTMPQDSLYGRGGAYQDRAPSAPVSKPPERFSTTAPSQPPPEVYGGPMQGQMPGQIPSQMQGQQFDDPSRNHDQTSVPPPPRRQETPKHQSYKSGGGLR